MAHETAPLPSAPHPLATSKPDNNPAERATALDASIASDHVAALLRVAVDLLDDFPVPVSPRNCEVIERIAAVIAAAEAFNARSREFIHARS